MQADKLAKMVIAYSLFFGILALLFVSELSPATKADGSGVGPIGDFINGILSPFLFFAASLLTYLNLKEQVKANLVQQKRFEEDKEERWKKERIDYIGFQINQIKDEIRSIQCTVPRDDSIYSGHKALFEFSKMYNRDPNTAVTTNEFILDRIYSHQVGYIMALREANRMKLGRDREDWVNYVCVAYTTDLKKYVETILENSVQQKPIVGGIKRKHSLLLRYMTDNGLINIGSDDDSEDKV